MKSYPATVIAVDHQQATVRLEHTGQEIVFEHASFNALPVDLRQVGLKGFIHFPKPPPRFARMAA